MITSLLMAKPIVVVSIVPEKIFVTKIAKEMLDVTVMVAPGNSPHSYEPKSSQMVALSNADLYLSIGVDFEDVWLPRFKSQNENLKFVDIAKGIKKRDMCEHASDTKRDAIHTHHGSKDPHTWTSPKNVGIMAKNIYEELVTIDPVNQQFYQSNLENFLKEIQDTDAKIKEILRDEKPQSKFMVFHPSWGYFADAYQLTQRDGVRPYLGNTT